LMRPDSGSVWVLGEDVFNMRPAQLTAFRRGRLGFIFQTFNLFPNLSALDNVRLAYCMRGMPARKAKALSADLLDQVGVGSRARLRPAQLSTGECQRVAVARALVGEPAIIFADEPTASLDAENGQAMMRLLSGLVQSRGMSLIVVTHDTRIYPFADRVLHLEDGCLSNTEIPTGAEIVPGYYEPERIGLDFRRRILRESVA
jgi:putative ABC transport system ATP-binding protein